MGFNDVGFYVLDRDSPLRRRVVPEDAADDRVRGPHILVQAVLLIEPIEVTLRRL